MTGEWGPVAGSVTYGDDVLMTASDLGQYGTGASELSAYPADWAPGDASIARAAAKANQAPGLGLAYSYYRDREVVGSVDHFRYRGTYGRRVIVTHAATISPPPLEPDYPAGATQWRWVGSTLNVVSAVLTAEFGYLEGKVAGVITPPSVQDDSVLYLKGAGGLGWTSDGQTPTSWSGEEQAVLASASVSAGGLVTADLTPWVDATNNMAPDVPVGRLSMVAGVDLDTPARFEGIDPTLNASFELRGGVSGTVAYTLSLGYQFFYPDGVPGFEAVNPLRRYPRHDPLGFGATGRNYPRPSGARNYGGQP